MLVGLDLNPERQKTLFRSACFGFVPAALLPSHPLHPPLAGLDLNPERQKALLRSACFGAAFCPHPAVTDAAAPTPSAPSLHAMCCKLRVLNALREARPGMPLTLVQLEALTLLGVVARYERALWVWGSLSCKNSRVMPRVILGLMKPPLTPP